jgi:hypothetical protein
MAVLSSAYVCCRSIVGIPCSNPNENMVCSSVVFAMCCASRDLCNELITRSEECCRVYVCLIACDVKASVMRLP